MLEKINTNKNVSVLSCVQKNDVITTKNLHIVTLQGTKTGLDNPQISNIKETNVYPTSQHEKKTYKEATHVFQNIARQEDLDNSRTNTILVSSNLLKQINQYLSS